MNICLRCGRPAKGLTLICPRCVPALPPEGKRVPPPTDLHPLFKAILKSHGLCAR